MSAPESLEAQLVRRGVWVPGMDLDATLTAQDSFVFRCPMCGNEVRRRERMAPACTGPSWTDDHPMEPMVLVR